MARIRAKEIIRLLQSRSIAISIITVAVFLMCLLPHTLPVVPAGTTGLIFSFGTSGIESPGISILASISILIAVTLIFILINRRFRLIKGSTWYFAGMFFIILLSFPHCYSGFSGGSITTAVVSVTTLLLFTIYASPRETETVFLIFLLCTTAGLWVIRVFFFVPLFFIGMAQMKVLKLKTFIAAILGILTPLWIVWGFGFATPLHLFFPVMDMPLSQVISNSNRPSLLALFVLIVESVIFLLGAFLRSMNYNSGRRACNAFVYLLNIYIIIIISVDTGGISTYIPLLAIITAFNAAHTFATRATDKMLLPMLVAPVIFICIATWNFL